MFTAKIDRVNKSITVSRNDLIAAGQFGTPEFEQMMKMMSKYSLEEIKQLSDIGLTELKSIMDKKEKQ